MPRDTFSHPRFKKTLLALAASAVLAPHGVWALDLAQSPPGTTEPYVAPNVIISIDDSGSMYWKISNSEDGETSIKTPKADGTWDTDAPRMNVLKYALSQVFNDTSLLPDKKIRVAWQAMWNNGHLPNANNVDSEIMNDNSMRVLQGNHRINLLNFVDKLSPGGTTPSHKLFMQADKYMRHPLTANSPWAAVPGTTGAPFLGCRRNYHIVMSDGGWSETPNTDESPGNTDGKSFVLPDGTPYNKVWPYADGHADSLADWAFKSWSTKLQEPSTLTGSLELTNDYRVAPPQENFGKDKSRPPKNAVLNRYWNPRYNPATWPHMVTYTIGFSKAATTWNGEPNIKRPPNTDIVPFGYESGKNGSLPDFITGNINWPKLSINTTYSKNPLDLWHAALNGRGRYYAVEKSEDLEKAFREILGKINTENKPGQGSNATSGSNNTRFDVGKYLASYEPENGWKGQITAETLKTDGSTVPTESWEGKSTADRLDDPGFNVDSRLILSWSDKKIGTSDKDKGGVSFKWAGDEENLSNAQKLWLQKNTSGTDGGTTKGNERLKFIRGDRSKEIPKSGGYLRERKSRQGDIVNSVVWYVGAPASNYPMKGYSEFTRENRSRTPVIYVGANDGMLHGFSTADGSEKIAYVPKGVIPALSYLADPLFNGNHRYFVDGSPMTGDVDMGTGTQDPADPTYDPAYKPNWRTLLVGTLGAGGKGYFALDVTNPNASANASGVPGFGEGNADKLVKLDRTRHANEPVPICTTTACEKTKAEDDDIGFITAQPVLDDANPMRTTQITRMNDNRWAVVMGNGYNSFNKRPVLLIQYLDGEKELIRLPIENADYAVDNGLSAPRLVDLNGDGRPDVVYAGDNLGNMWKFDIAGVEPAKWKVAFDGNPLFTATGPVTPGSAARTKVQPITAAPTVRANDRKACEIVADKCKPGTNYSVGGMMVAFGTGRNIAQNDAANVDVQTLYSVLDNTRYSIETTSKGKRMKVHPGGGTCPKGADCVVPPQALGSGVSFLEKQTVGAEQAGSGINADRSFSATSTNNVEWGTKKGWYMDLPSVGERLLKPIGFFDGSNILTVYSQVPAKGSNVDPNIESCTANTVDGERQYLSFINIMDGKRPSVQLMDLNGDGAYNSLGDKGASRVSLTKGSHSLITQGKKIIDFDAKNKKLEFARMPEESLRPSWRQLR